MTIMQFYVIRKCILNYFCSVNFFITIFTRVENRNFLSVLDPVKSEFHFWDSCISKWTANISNLLKSKHSYLLIPDQIHTWFFFFFRENFKIENHLNKNKRFLPKICLKNNNWRSVLNLKTPVFMKHPVSFHFMSSPDYTRRGNVWNF